jgi:hypothetical protein
MMQIHRVMGRYTYITCLQSNMETTNQGIYRIPEIQFKEHNGLLYLYHGNRFVNVSTMIDVIYQRMGRTGK